MAMSAQYLSIDSNCLRSFFIKADPNPNGKRRRCYNSDNKDNNLSMNVSEMLVPLFYCTDKTTSVSANHQTVQNHLVGAIMYMMIFFL